MPMTQSIEELTQAYLAYVPVLRGLVRRILRNRDNREDEIRDILQEVWIKAAIAITQHDVEYVKKWLGSIAINTALSYIRKRSNMTTHFIVLKPERLQDPQPLQDELLQRRELRERLASAVETLSPTTQAAVRLVYFEEKKAVDAAAEIGVPYTSFRSSLHRGIHALGNTLTDLKQAA